MVEGPIKEGETLLFGASKTVRVKFVDYPEHGVGSPYVIVRFKDGAERTVHRSLLFRPFG